MMSTDVDTGRLVDWLLRQSVDSAWRGTVCGWVAPRRSEGSDATNGCGWRVDVSISEATQFSTIWLAHGLGRLYGSWHRLE
jgi:hypothetical protein